MLASVEWEQAQVSLAVASVYDYESEILALAYLRGGQLESREGEEVDLGAVKEKTAAVEIR